MERIRQLRKERGLSQARLAVMADMDPATLNRLEQGKGNPNLKTLERVADALGCEVADFFPKAAPPLSLFDPSDRGGEALRRWMDYLEPRVADHDLDSGELKHELDAVIAFGMGPARQLGGADYDRFFALARALRDEGRARIATDAIESELRDLDAQIRSVEDVRTK